jgi:hypothetical protein
MRSRQYRNSSIKNDSGGEDWTVQAVGQVKGWKVQQIVFVGGTCGSVHVESFNKNMKAFRVLESQWDPIRRVPLASETPT